MKNLLMIAAVAFGFTGFVGCATSPEKSDDGAALDNVDQDAACEGHNCPAAHVNGTACGLEMSVINCINAKVAIGEVGAKPDVCPYANRGQGHPNVSGVLFGFSQQPGWIPSTLARANYAGPTNVSMAVACAVLRDMPVEQTYTPGNPDSCSIAVDINGFRGKWVVDNGVSFCESGHNYGNGG